LNLQRLCNTTTVFFFLLHARVGDAFRCASLTVAFARSFLDCATIDISACAQISDVAWAPLTLRIPHWLVSLRARNASVVAVADTSGGGNYALTTLVLDDNALAPAQQAFSLGYILMLTETLQVFSCQHCGLQVDVAQLIPGASASTAKRRCKSCTWRRSAHPIARGACVGVQAAAKVQFFLPVSRASLPLCCAVLCCLSLVSNSCPP